MLASRRIVNTVSSHIASRALMVGGARQGVASIVRNKLPSRCLQHTAVQTDRVITDWADSQQVLKKHTGNYNSSFILNWYQTRGRTIPTDFFFVLAPLPARQICCHQDWWRSSRSTRRACLKLEFPISCGTLSCRSAWRRPPIKRDP